jgi:hypothetical protein
MWRLVNWRAVSVERAGYEKGLMLKLEQSKTTKMTRDKIYWQLTLTRKWPGIRRNPSLGFRSHTRETRWRSATRQYTHTHTLRESDPSVRLRPLVRLRKGLGVHTGKWEGRVRDKWAVCYIRPFLTRFEFKINTQTDKSNRNTNKLDTHNIMFEFDLM